ncbi:F-actin-capping protein subunit beta [Mitosporidium daphniae]
MTCSPILSSFDPFKLSLDSSFLGEADKSQNPFDKLPWGIETCDLSKRLFIKSVWNQMENGTSRSPWINEPTGGEKEALEFSANEIFQNYATLYYEGSDSLCSFFITSTSPNGWDFIILIQSTIEHQKEDSDNHPSSYFSSWNSVHKGNVKLDEGSKCCEYKLRSSVAVRSKKTCEKERENEAADSSNWNAPTLYQSLHLKHIGTLLESSESKLRLSILDIHSQAPSIALKSAFKFQSIGLSPKAMNPACQSEFLRKVQSRNATEQS